MSELTDDERRDLICDCGASACGVDECPHHGGNDELWVDVPARVMADRVEAIIDARVQAERDRLLARIEALVLTCEEGCAGPGLCDGSCYRTIFQYEERAR